MKTEAEIRTAMTKIIEHYENFVAPMPQHWISMTYFNLALLWVIGDTQEIPQILLPKTVEQIKTTGAKDQ